MHFNRLHFFGLRLNGSVPDIIIRWLIIGVVLLLAVPSAARTEKTLLGAAPVETSTSDPFTFHVEATPPAVTPGQSAAVTILAKIPSGHKLYASAMDIEPADVPGLRFGKLKTPESVEQREPDGEAARFYVNDASFVLPVELGSSIGAGRITVPLVVRYRGCSETRCFMPREKQLNAVFTVDLVDGSLHSKLPASGKAAGLPGSAETIRVPPEPAPSIVTEVPGKNPGQDSRYARAARRFGLPGVLAAAFVWGLLASLTPCVYPMIPITMGVIGALSTGSAARGFSLSLVYVLGMSVVYAVFGVAAAWSGTLFGAWSDDPAVRMFVAGVFVMLAMSLFDLFQIRMPSWIASRLGGKFGGGIIGVFFTGAAAGAVVGPCVGPLLVALLAYVAALGDKFQGFLIMWSFAVGMGTLFLLIGTFSGAAASLPRSGPWMERIKHAFGVLMLGVALYYVAPLLPETIVWLCIGAFLIGIGTFIGALDHLSSASGGYDRLKKSVGILCLTLGIVYAARFALGEAKFSKTVAPQQQSEISWMYDETAALAAAGRRQKPLLIDFYADWCSACKRLDRITFSDPAVVAAAREFVPLKIDNSNSRDPDAAFLRKKYGVVGLPAIVFVGPEGQVIREETITEFVPPGVLLDRMKRVTAALSDLPRPRGLKS